MSNEAHEVKVIMDCLKALEKILLVAYRKNTG